MTIIKVDPVAGTHLHPIQTQSHREKCWEDGYIEVPQNIEQKVTECSGYCDLVISSGVLIDVIPCDKPTADKEPTAEETMLELLADQEYRLCMIELGLK